MSTTRRKFNAALIAVAAALSLIGQHAALAQDVDVAELAKPVPLGDIVLGSANAPVTMIEYASLSCGHCAAFHTGIYPTIKAEYIDTGKLRFIFREYPLDLQAAAASMVARCVGNGDPQKYHETAGRLFATQDQWVRDGHGSATAPDREQVRAGRRRVQHLPRQPGDGRRASSSAWNTPIPKLKVNSTPTFFVNGTQLKGAWSVDEFRKLIEAKLKS